MKTLILAWLMSQPISRYDALETPDSRVARLEVIADAAARVSNGDRLKAAYLLVQAKHESGFRRDVQLCECPKLQCDRGLAHGLTQVHASSVGGAANWWRLCGIDLDSTLLQFRAIGNRYDPVRLETSIARLGGITVPITAHWVLRRAAEARKLARIL